MSSTMVQSPTHPRFNWRPSADEVEAIVAEMRPLITALAAEERRRLDRLVAPRDKRSPTRIMPPTSSGSEHASARATTTFPAPNRPRRLPTVRAVEAELGQYVLLALLNENSFNPQRRITALRRRLERAANGREALAPSACAPPSLRVA